MKLKPDFITQNIDSTQFLVPIGAGSFQGIVRSNKTAAFIVDCLKEETTEEAIIDVMCKKYDAPRNVITSRVASYFLHMASMIASSVVSSLRQSTMKAAVLLLRTMP